MVLLDIKEIYAPEQHKSRGGGIEKIRGAGY